MPNDIRGARARPRDALAPIAAALIAKLATTTGVALVEASDLESARLN